MIGGLRKERVLYMPNEKANIESDGVGEKRIVLRNCSFVKTILMLLVILYHSSVFWKGTWFTENPILESRKLAIFSEWLNSFHIYGFVLVSGFIYSYARNELGKYQDYKVLIIGKMKRLLIPYYFVAILWVIPIQNIFLNYDMKTIIKYYILAEKPNQLWFLWMLFVVFILVNAVIDKVDKSSAFAVIFSLGSFLFYVILRGKIPDYFQIIMAFQYITFFVIGYYLQKVTIHYNVGFALFAIDIFLFCADKFWIPNGTSVFSLVHIVVGYFLHITGAIMSFVVLQLIAGKVSWENNKVFGLLSENSMAMYLFHQQLIYFSIVLLNGKVVPWMNALANYIVALLGSLAMSVLLKRWKTTSFLIGEKVKS